MATPVTLVHPNQDGVAPAAEVSADTVDGNSIPNHGRTHLVLRNTDTVARGVTFNTPSSVSGFSVSDHVVSLAAGETRHFGDFPQAAFGQEVVFTADSAMVQVAAYIV